MPCQICDGTPLKETSETGKRIETVEPKLREYIMKISAKGSKTAKTNKKSLKNSTSRNKESGKSAKKYTPFPDRDIVKRPYTYEEMRVVDFIQVLTDNQIGGGDDPIGFILASYGYIQSENQELRRRIQALELDNQRLSGLCVWKGPE